MSIEAEEWIAAQEKLVTGKVDIRILIDEGQRRGYCICPKPMRQIIDFKGMTCKWCEMPETQGSWDFWYLIKEPGKDI